MKKAIVASALLAASVSIIFRAASSPNAFFFEKVPKGGQEYLLSCVSGLLLETRSPESNRRAVYNSRFLNLYFEFRLLLRPTFLV